MIEEMNHRAQYPILQTLHSLHQLSGIAIGDGEGGHPKGPLRAANVRVARVEESTLQRHALVPVPVPKLVQMLLLVLQLT